MIESNTKFVNSKASHANLLYSRWRSHARKNVFSQRLGISYTETIHARDATSVRQHGNVHMYRKRLANFSITPSTNPRVRKAQEIRFQRACRRIFNMPEHNRRDDYRHKIITAQRYRFLFLKSQYINKPVKHLKYTRGLTRHDYSFSTPFTSILVPPRSPVNRVISVDDTLTPSGIVHSVAPYNPIPNMFIPLKYRSIIPTNPLYG